MPYDVVSRFPSYGNNESCVVEFQGPGIIDVEHMSTEGCCDKLTFTLQNGGSVVRRYTKGTGRGGNGTESDWPLRLWDAQKSVEVTGTTPNWVLELSDGTAVRMQWRSDGSVSTGDYPTRDGWIVKFHRNFEETTTPAPLASVSCDRSKLGDLCGRVHSVFRETQSSEDVSTIANFSESRYVALADSTLDAPRLTIDGVDASKSSNSQPLALAGFTSSNYFQGAGYAFSVSMRFQISAFNAQALLLHLSNSADSTTTKEYDFSIRLDQHSSDGVYYRICVDSSRREN
jgi:hypothetical protein